MARDFHKFLQRLESEICARDFICFVLSWAAAPPEDFEIARELDTRRAIALSKEFLPIYMMENIEGQTPTRH